MPNESQHIRLRTTRATFVVGFCLCVYWVVLFYSTHTKLPPNLLPGNSDKYIHTSAYAVLGVLLISVRATRGPFRWTSVASRWLCLAAYGAFDELTQLLANRTADLHDWYADLFGAAIGLCAATVVIRSLQLYPRPDKSSSTLPVQPSAVAE